MTRTRWVAAFLGFALAASSAPAQGVFISYGSPYCGYPVGGAFFSFGRGHGHLSIALGSPAYGPYGYGYGYTSTQVTVVVTRPVVVAPPDPEDLTLEMLRASLENDPPRPNPPVQGEQHFGGFHKVEPPGGRPAQPPERLRAPAPAQPAPPPPQPVQPPVKPLPAPAQPPLAEPPELPMPPAPLNDPDAEYNRLLGLGREAFANLEYGRAADRFRQAAVLAPKQGLPLFLLAQTLFAQGKYPDAVDAIDAGMILQPDWPNAPFQPLELYGAHPADYTDQLKALQDALNGQPGDPNLLFLDAYALWFDGRKDDAQPLFEKALPGAVDPGMVLRFLRAAAGGASL
jgi:hypothetical protein